MRAPAPSPGPARGRGRLSVFVRARRRRADGPTARLDTPGDSNGLLWSEDGRFLPRGGRLRSTALASTAQPTGSWPARRGSGARSSAWSSTRRGPPARSWPATTDACGRCRPDTGWRRAVGRDRAPARDVGHHRGGHDDATGGAELLRPRVPHRARRDAGAPGEDVGPQPNPTYGCNWVAVHPSGEELAVTHDDGCIRIREGGRRHRLLRTMGPWLGLVVRGGRVPPDPGLLATIDFYGEVLPLRPRRQVASSGRRTFTSGPGISVDFSPCGRWLGGGRLQLAWARPASRPRRHSRRRPRARSPQPGRPQERGLRRTGAPARGIGGRHPRRARPRRRPVHGRPLHPRNAADGAVQRGRRVARPGRVAYVGVARSVGAGVRPRSPESLLATGLAHVRGVKCVHVSECGRHVVTGSYDRTVMLWNADDLTVRLPPARLANSGVSGVRCGGGRVYTCSFDGVVSALELATGRLLWCRTAADVADGH